jgi:dipeptidyl aminopeptidase/acylaminoacyl peptidase
VDEADRSLVLAAGGREPRSNPYVRSLYRLDLDSATLQPFCTDGLDHAAVGSPSGRVVVDVTSGLGTPARSVLRRSTGEVVADLESADASALLEAGYAPPEPFVVKAADGITDLHGVLFRPHGFDPTQRWPVLDEIYPGPAHAPAPVRFPGDSGPTTFTHQPAFAALGFAVITLNSRGTPLRSRAFRDATRGNTYDEGLLDHVMALQQLHQQHPWLDLSRVGIYGASGGGHASARALMLHPETYRAAAAACGSHDERLYHAMWAERFVGSTSSTDYVAKDNASLAERMTGRLLLIHGELDDNVLPHLTVRLLDALMLADKDVDLLLVPNSDHDLGTHRHHWWRRRWDFLVRHVMGVEPPNYRLAPIPDDPSATLRRVGLG